MKVCLLLLLSVLATSYAHTYFSSITVDGQAYGEGDCVREHPVGTTNFPIPTVSQADMTCGWLPLGAKAANRKCPVAPGSRVSIHWHYASAAPGDIHLDHSHHGPTMVYMAKSEDGQGPVWFKIFEQGLVDPNANPQVWGTDVMINNGGKLEFTIPTDIAPGNYLLRGEIIALHSAYNLDGAQPYVGCAEITISGSGTAYPAGVSIPGAYQNTDPGIYVSIYNSLTSYVIPGPPVYTSGSAPSTGSPPVQPTSPPNPPPPASSDAVPIYTDSVQSPPAADYSWATTRNAQDGAYAYTGSYSYSFTPENWGAVFLYCQSCIDTTKFDSIEFFVNGGATGGQNVYFDLIKGAGSVQPSNSIAYYTSSNIPANTWVRGSVPLSLFASGVYDGIWFQDHSGSPQGTLYIDAISLIPRVVPKGNINNNTKIDTGNDSDGRVKNEARHSTSQLVITNVITAIVTLSLVSLVVVLVYAYQKRKNASEYQYNQFVENGQL